jgi:hypothetical protein
MNEIFQTGFWTARRRAWLYGIATAFIPLLIGAGYLAPEMAGNVLFFIAALLGVGGGTMALANLTPDTIFKVGLEMEMPEQKEDE